MTHAIILALMQTRVIYRPLRKDHGFHCALRMLMVVFTIVLAGYALQSRAKTAHFDYAKVNAIAHELAQTDYVEPDYKVPEALKKLDHDQYSQIRYKTDKRLWHDTALPFSISFLPVGNHYLYPVKINEVDRDGVRTLHFDPSLFNFGDLHVNPDDLTHTEFSGLMVHFRFDDTLQGKSTDKLKHDDPFFSTKDTAMVFQGGSIFRGEGEDQVMGASARGLAIDTGLESGEELPRFTEIWVNRPTAKDHAMVIYALMDSKSATGAYRFALYPGRGTTVDVKAHIYMRKDVSVLGFAALTGMYLYGENDTRSRGQDFRPEVHDVDGLQIHAGNGEWFFRPFNNPERLVSTSFAMTAPEGFGLMQRDHNFANYEDLEHRFDRKASVWVQPQSDWGKGRIQLLELPTPDETHDNIIAFWQPEKIPKAGESIEFDYRLRTESEHVTYPPTSWVSQTYHGKHVRQSHKKADVDFMLDFNGSALHDLARDSQVDASIDTDKHAQLVYQVVRYNPVTKGRRLFFGIDYKGKKVPIKLRAHLTHKDKPVSETWVYALPQP